jgi:type IV secretory pathway TraG/TraD family ATPase VirD4
LLVLAALLLAPTTWAVGTLIAGGIGAAAVAVSRDLRTRRAARSVSRGEDGAVPLGVDQDGHPVLLSDQQLSAHGLIVGASGAGKSTTLLTILTERIRQGGPVIAIDMKGSPSFAHELARAAAAAGRPFRCWTLDGTSYWNPLEHGNATELKDKLIATERFTEPHYQRAAERYVQTALQVLRDANPNHPVELDEVVRAMEPSRLSSMLRLVPRARAEQVQDYLAALTPDQLSAVRGLATRLAIISESHSGRYLSPGGGVDPGASGLERGPGAGSGERIDLHGALDGPDVVVFSLNSSTYGQLAAQVGTLAIQDLISATGHRLTVPQSERAQAMIAVDEFSALGADHVVSLLARGRESGVSVLLATQELADLERAAPGFRDQVLGVTAVKIAHRQDVPASAQIIAQMAGTEWAWEEAMHIRGAFGRHDGSRGTRRAVERFVVHPNEIKSLRTGEAVVLRKLPIASARTIRVAPPRVPLPGRDGPAAPGRDGPALG